MPLTARDASALYAALATMRTTPEPRVIYCEADYGTPNERSREIGPDSDWTPDTIDDGDGGEIAILRSRDGWTIGDEMAMVAICPVHAKAAVQHDGPAQPHVLAELHAAHAAQVEHWTVCRDEREGDCATCSRLADAVT